MKKVIVDTSVIIDYLRRKNKKESLFHQVFIKEKNKPIIPLTVISELWAGKSMSNKNINNFVSGLIDKCQKSIPNEKIAKKTGKILRDHDYEISFQDAQIAAIAVSNNWPVLTFNDNDFKKVEGLILFKK